MANEAVVPGGAGAEGTVVAGAEGVKPEGAVPQVASLKDDDLVEVQWNGQKIVKPWKEARANIQMQEDYTRSKQALAARAKEVEDIYTSLVAKDKEITERREAIDAILGRADGKRGTKPEPPKDDEVVTVGTVKQMLQEAIEGTRKEFGTKVSEVQTQSEQARLFQRYEDLTSEAVSSLTKEHPILGRIPNLQAALKLEAAKERPQTEKEMVAALVKAGKAVAKSFDEAYTEQKKAEAARKATLTSKGTEAPGGTPVLQAPNKDYTKKGSRSVNWDAVEADALAALDALE